MIPSELTREHVIAALADIDRNGVPAGRCSRGYDLLHDSRSYPPKYAVALAVELPFGRKLTSEEFGGGEETNRRLAQLGFAVVGKGEGPPGGPLRVALVSLRTGPPQVENGALRRAFAAARQDHDGELLMLFPGASNHWSSDPVGFLNLARSHSASCIAELSFPTDAAYTSYRHGNDQLDPLRIVQVFGEAREAIQPDGSTRSSNNASRGARGASTSLAREWACWSAAKTTCCRPDNPKAIAAMACVAIPVGRCSRTSTSS